MASLDSEGFDLDMSNQNLAQLIRTRKELNRWSYREIQERAQRAGHQISKTRLQELAIGKPLEAITADVMRGIAAGLDVAVSTVVQAAVISLGFELPHGGPSSPEEAIARDVTLTEPERRMLLAQLRELRAATAEDPRRGYLRVARRGAQDPRDEAGEESQAPPDW